MCRWLPISIGAAGHGGHLSRANVIAGWFRKKAQDHPEKVVIVSFPFFVSCHNLKITTLTQCSDFSLSFHLYHQKQCLLLTSKYQLCWNSAFLSKPNLGSPLLWGMSWFTCNKGHDPQWVRETSPRLCSHGTRVPVQLLCSLHQGKCCGQSWPQAMDCRVCRRAPSLACAHSQGSSWLSACNSLTKKSCSPPQ